MTDPRHQHTFELHYIIQLWGVEQWVPVSKCSPPRQLGPVPKYWAKPRGVGDVIPPNPNALRCTKCGQQGYRVR